jgi:GMP synthase PP-ATPase subunit
MRSYVETAVEQIRQQVGKDQVFCALSGGWILLWRRC